MQIKDESRAELGITVADRDLAKVEGRGYREMTDAVSCELLIETGKRPLSEFQARGCTQLLEMITIGIVEVIDGHIDIRIAAVVPFGVVLQQSVMLNGAADIGSVTGGEGKTEQQTNADMCESHPHRRPYNRRDYRLCCRFYQARRDGAPSARSSPA